MGLHFYINTQYLVFRCPNRFGICLGMCNLHLCWGKLNLPFMSLVLLSYQSIQRVPFPYKKLTSHLKIFPLLNTLLSLSLPLFLNGPLSMLHLKLKFCKKQTNCCEMDHEIPAKPKSATLLRAKRKNDMKLRHCKY